MTTEMAVLNVKKGLEKDFESAFKEAVQYISRTKGYISHSLQKCIETKNRYLFTVQWATLDSHMINFRQSTDYIKWKDLLHHFYDPTPVVEHYEEF
ncbi:MAG: Antibiotic biosynthesis monooxygenase [uncultured Campylobacterales bacterium]|uniref:Antibiotic biosynthesis monooxygenase n=1 Tax=uncultured Campylobacterales bacterium TaxID=352960 RepID=A0A6S6RYB7_9BACT|nr:MAG: Antibiotic biosynthesis monooxygenase [uncultured Campylobacterales bacterium]